jgi:phosphoglycolate phosphatase
MSSRAAIIFDLDGTLVDSLDDIAFALNRVLAGRGLGPLAADQVVTMIGHGSRNLVAAGLAATAAPGYAADDAETDACLGEFLAAYGEGLTRFTRPYPGVADALATLARRRYGLAVCTNKTEAHAIAVLRALDLLDFFPVIVGGDTLPGIRKPDSRLLLPVIEALCATSETVVLVGDSATDVALARAGKLRAVILRAGGYSPQPAADLGADAVIQHFDELAPLISQLLRN